MNRRGFMSALAALIAATPLAAMLPRPRAMLTMIDETPKWLGVDLASKADATVTFIASRATPHIYGAAVMVDYLKDGELRTCEMVKRGDELACTIPAECVVTGVRSTSQQFVHLLPTPIRLYGDEALTLTHKVTIGA